MIGGKAVIEEAASLFMGGFSDLAALKRSANVYSGSADAGPLAEIIDGENALERLLNFLLIHGAPDWKLVVLDIELQNA